ncbi:HigA family addiction module antitoxin [Rhodoferax antarcticus]|uniref:Addiction module antidote protein, HigA family n=1 Tax=Rhodoferax antarcticus ANT.BR TaxID=1111071 RepID=A0A1Q8YDX8_9BURK|nr:HigA family addiction module antitoxin [Rhodoferax antarcticus]APW46063.1 addiction module antidote protein, HigA family [Rhodoferax antarcticus]MCW2310366.1 addiction module HigA family antidote [Rhodoferax antarcticus]OLP06213.1 addiction module antidote protein, HigA family [Rhodoferax antarcticus ANT.BR]
MILDRTDLDTLDFSDVATGKRLTPVHPGEVLREEFLTPNGLTANALAIRLGVPAPRIHDIVRCRRAVTVDTALRLAQFFGTSAEFWTSLQTDFDMTLARDAMREVLGRIGRFEEVPSQGF